MCQGAAAEIAADEGEDVSCSVIHEDLAAVAALERKDKPGKWKMHARRHGVEPEGRHRRVIMLSSAPGGRSLEKVARILGKK